MPPTNPLEPQTNPSTRRIYHYLGATRPAFLSITLVAVMLGFATAWQPNLAINISMTSIALFLALLTHAGINVLNDYYDHLNGTDAINTDRIFPFTGGSRYIQNGVLSPENTLYLGIGLIAVVIIGGLWLMQQSSMGLLWIGLSGLFLGWAYSAPPFKLNSRGLGELSVTLGFLLIVVGAHFIIHQQFQWRPWLIGLPFALMVTNILYINQFPDFHADQQAGKHHWVVRLSLKHAAWGYVLILALSALTLIVLVVTNELPLLGLIALIAVLPAMKASSLLIAHAQEPSALVLPIKLTILAAHLIAILLVVVLIL